MWSEIDNMICLRHLVRSTAGANLKLIFKKTFYVQRCVLCSKLLYDIATIVSCRYNNLYERYEDDSCDSPIV